ncbi:AlpA family phage regulatory protein [Lysobacter sp. HX-5-24]|uniref:AlpA family phage regulatory protein n=2 Tax=Noviluteimonas gilva TaxID=2682097 RepID=A0A7C9LGP2_9GAMM|nr:AlpA family transcriptional regulator [Lysobacter gilvus]MUV13360.1 AlpA family phage regulatory protein [Lysobacter gilvus]
MNVQSTNTILRLKQVKEITGLGRSTIYLYMKEGKFPKQRELGERAVGWHSVAVFQWVAERQVAR